MVAVPVEQSPTRDANLPAVHFRGLAAATALLVVVYSYSSPPPPQPPPRTCISQILCPIPYQVLLIVFESLVLMDTMNDGMINTW